MGSVGSRWIAAGMIAAATVAAVGAMGRGANAQQGANVQTPLPKDYNQRSLRIFEFRKSAESGPDRGQEIFYYKCWFCHNEFTSDIPKLTGLFQHATLLDGQPVNADTVKNQIRNGSANMAAYKYTLSESDINDLVSYLRERCCWNSDAPPRNPAYIAR